MTDQSVEEIFLESLKKLDALADEFGIKRKGPAGWGFLLALAIALKYVPGFRPVPKQTRGRRGYRKSPAYQGDPRDGCGGGAGEGHVGFRGGA